jgi:hypothetical protein
MITGAYMPIAILQCIVNLRFLLCVKIATGFLSRRKLRDSESEKIRGNPASPNAGDRYKRICKREYGPIADRPSKQVRTVPCTYKTTV